MNMNERGSLKRFLKTRFILNPTFSANIMPYLSGFEPKALTRGGTFF